MNSSELEIKFDDKVELAHKELVQKYISRLQDAGLPVILSPEHLEQILRIRIDQLYAIANSPDSFYREHFVTKKNGGRRRISAPLPLLLFVQKWVLENILEQQSVHPSAKAYLKKSSIKHNARFHRNQSHLFKSDVKDFFGSIPSKWVYEYFVSLGYSSAVSMLLTSICTKSNSLPQGAPTSGYLSNLYMKSFDEAMFAYCTEKTLRYTRYADDIAVSGAKIDFSEMSLMVKRQLKDIDLKIHSGKTRLVRSHQRQRVTGVVVNERLSPGREYLRTLRQDLYFLEKYGIYEHSKNRGWSSPSAFLNNIYGRLTHAIFLTGNDNNLVQKKNELETLIREIEYKTE